MLAAQQESIEHLSGWSQVPDAELSVFAARCAKSETWNCPTLVVHDLPWSALRDLDRAWLRPEVALVSPSIRARWDPATDPRFAGIAKLDDELWAGQQQRLDRMRRVVRELRDAGAPLLLGTDAPNPFIVPGYAVHQELELLVSAGLTPFEALRAGTSAAAEFLRLDGEIGVVAEGRCADLLLLAGNPLEDVRADAGDRRSRDRWGLAESPDARRASRRLAGPSRGAR